MIKNGNIEKDTLKSFEQALVNKERQGYVLRLFVSGTTPKSMRAVENINWICKKYLKGRYDLKVIDAYQELEQMTMEQVVALPTLIKKLPPPARRIVGDMSNYKRVCSALSIDQ